MRALRGPEHPKGTDGGKITLKSLNNFGWFRSHVEIRIGEKDEIRERVAYQGTVDTQTCRNEEQQGSQKA